MYEKQHETNHEGRGMKILAIFFSVLALLLLLILFDMKFVPSGNLWNSVKQDYIEFSDLPSDSTDKQIWSEIKALTQEELCPVPSGIINWIAVSSKFKKELKREQLHNEKILSANETAAQIMEIVNETKFENIPDFETINIVFMHSGVYTYSSSSESEVPEQVSDKLFAAFPECDGRALAVIVNNKCTAAAFIPSANTEIVIGQDCPNLNSDGSFDFDSIWGGGFTIWQADFIVGCTE